MILEENRWRPAVSESGRLIGSLEDLVCLFLWTPSFEGNRVSLMGISLTSRAGIDGNAPYQVQELHITGPVE